MEYLAKLVKKNLSHTLSIMLQEDLIKLINVPGRI